MAAAASSHSEECPMAQLVVLGGDNRDDAERPSDLTGA
jgi:hypothetical protein